MGLVRSYSATDIAILLRAIEGTSHPAAPARRAHTITLHAHGNALALLDRSTGQPGAAGRARAFVTSFRDVMVAAKCIAEIFGGGKGRSSLSSLEADPDDEAFKVVSARVDCLRPGDIVGAARGDEHPDPNRPRGSLHPYAEQNTVTVVFGKFTRDDRRLWPWVETCYPEVR